MPLLLILLFALPVTAQQATPPWAEAVAERLWERLQSAPWDKRYYEAATYMAALSLTCEQFHGGGGYSSWAERQWSYHCLFKTSTHEEEHYFYAFPVHDTVINRYQQFRAFAAGLSVTAVEKIHRDLSRRLAARYGAPEEPTGTDFRSRYAFGVSDFGSGSWHHIQRWQTDDLEIVLYVDEPGDRQPRLGVRARHRHLLDAKTEDKRLYRVHDYVRMGPLKEKLERELTSNLSDTFPSLSALLAQDRTKQDDNETISTLLRLLEAAKTAEPMRRPTLLLAADHLATRFSPSLPEMNEKTPEWDQLRKKLSGYGLRYQRDELDAGWFYFRDLLMKVWKEYPETRWGEYAFAELLNYGMNPTVGCANGSDTFHSVIEQGAKFLSERPQSPRRLEVSFTLARAYETWWSLSQAAPVGSYGSPENYLEGADQARVSAIKHFQEVVRLAPESGEALYARRRLPRLQLGFDTNQRRFFCWYD